MAPTTPTTHSPAEPTTAPPTPRSSRGHSPGRLAALCTAHPWRTLAAALLVLAGAVALLTGGLRTTSPADQLVGDSAAAQRITDRADFGTGAVENVVLTARTGVLDAAAVARLDAQLRATYAALPAVAHVSPLALAEDGRTAVAAVELSAAPSDDAAVATAVTPVLEATERLADQHPELQVGQVGPGSIDAEVGRATDRDFQRAELISLPVTLGILLIAFGAVVAAGVPVLLGLGAVVTALGATALVSRTASPVDRNTQSLVLLIGLAVGVDYALFVVRRAREERLAGAGTLEAVRTASATAGRAVLVSGATVVVAMAGMLVAGGLFTSLAIGSMIVVAVAVVAAGTVLPALLRLLGDRIGALRLPLTTRRELRAGSTDGAWGRLAGAVTRRPVVAFVVAGGLLVALAVPALGMRTSLPGSEELPRSFATVQTYDRLTAAFPQQGTTLDVVVEAPASAAPRVEAALAAGWRAAASTPVVRGEAPEVKASVDRRVHVLALAVPVQMSDPALDADVDRVRAEVLPVVRSSLDASSVTGASVHLGGAAGVTDLTRWMDSRLPWVIGFVLVLTFVVMALSFGSLWLAGATVGLNLLSVGAAYGAMTLVFQHTWAEGLLDFRSVGSIAAWLPLLMFVVLFGLSMDYHVFVVSRVREAWTAGVGPREAVRIGVARSAGVVTSAAAVMVAVFSIFATLSVLEMKQLGVGLATAVLLDATLVRGALLPAVLTLLGRRAHTGPRWLPALHG